jgi:excinuclease ABC subunit A
MPVQHAIRIRGARQHNLKNIDLNIPLNRITVVTGVSGSGKSSLAFDTLYAEGQRRYVETFSPYARQFMERMDRPQVDTIEGIPPAIAIDRKDPVRTSRSTVGTMTEITDYVKLLFSRIGVLHCRSCGQPVIPETPNHVWQQLESLDEGASLVITFPYRVQGLTVREIRKSLGPMGYDRYLYTNAVVDIAGGVPEALDTVDIVADRLSFRRKDRKRIVDSIEQAFRFGGGRMDVTVEGRRWSFSLELTCAACSIAYSPALPSLFSFNSPVGACETCRGFGRVIGIDLDLIVPDPGLSLAAGAIKPWGAPPEPREEYHDLMAFCRREKIEVDIPFARLPEAHRRAVVEGTDGFYGIRGFFSWLEKKTYKMHVRVFLARYRSYDVCPDCHGTRFKPETRLFRVGGCSIAEIYAMNVAQAAVFFDAISPVPDEATALVLGEIRSRLSFLSDVGLPFLTMDRQSRSLSGGEVQRVALASALGASLVNTLYVLDEPSIGLHPRDTKRLTAILKRLRDLNNTVVVVEHDPEIIAQSDYLLDLGPRAGEQGGQVTYFGPTAGVNGSLTGQYLTGKRSIEIPQRRPVPIDWPRLTICGAAEHNLKTIDVAIPLGRLVCLTGVSGSGKSTLAETILYRGLKREGSDSQGKPGRHDRIEGAGPIADVVLVDQRAIGRTPRANLLTYTGAMDALRRLFAKTQAAREAGLDAGHFSFNVDRGRCPACKGDGYEKIEMQFLSDVYITCASCAGKRFRPEVLDIRYQGKSIDDVFAMTVAEALVFFGNVSQVCRPLLPLAEVGLDYIRLGQPLSTLSGGEAQRLKLSKFLDPADTGGRRLFIFDEPTTGLHFHDIGKLLAAFSRLVDQGHSLLVIEHNMDVIKTADWVLELGPEGGEGGGYLVAQGPPEVVAAMPESPTGRYLKKVLGGAGRLNQTAVAEAVSVYRPADAITVRGAREHNLKDLSVSIPRNRLVVLTGVSGSGKSTLAFDILFAEGQRRYLESLAPYVRQYMKVLERPDVDQVNGLPPAVAIEQRISHASRRSTVATLTEIYHFLRLLFSRLGTRHCTGCGRAMDAQPPEAIVEAVVERYGHLPAVVLAPKLYNRKGFHKALLARARVHGYVEAHIDGALAPITEAMALDRYRPHTIALVAGRFPAADAQSAQAMVRRALEEGDGTVAVAAEEGKAEVLFSVHGVCPECGLGIEAGDPRLFSFNSPIGACPACKGLGQIEVHGDWRSCPECAGSRLKAEARAVTVDMVPIDRIVSASVTQSRAIIEAMRFSKRQLPVAQPIVSEIKARLALLDRLGLSYLSLGRSGDTLSGGEAQRVRLAAQLGSNLTGVLYILDEPTIGLHPRDNRLMLDALVALRDRGNTILVVEHDEETIRAADTVIDLGPGAGRFGGEIVAAGTLDDLRASGRSVTGAALYGGPPAPPARRRAFKQAPVIGVQGACANNLKTIDVDFPLNTLICVTGVSGSGKSSLLKSTLFRALSGRFSRKKKTAGPWTAISGEQSVDRVLEVDHSPIGRTPRSVPASYVGALDEIRKLFAKTPDARVRGYGPGRFSFNVTGGRCEACKGQGTPKVTMSFLPDVYVPCEVCRGTRFDRETLAVTYRGKTIAEVLELTFAEATDFFAGVSSLKKTMQFVTDIGLGYLELGQPSPTLSGGEAQRIKLAEQLARPGRGHSLYILDEPSTGLHAVDVRRLVGMLQALVDQGNTVAVIEHNLEVIAAADHVIDLGPEGGSGGGRLVAAGAPEEIAACQGSHTGRYLKRYLGMDDNPPVAGVVG